MARCCASSIWGHYRCCEAGLLAGAEDGGQDAGAAASVRDGDDPERLFVGRIGDQVFAHANEAQGARCEVGALVTLVGRRRQAIDPAGI